MLSIGAYSGALEVGIVWGLSYPTQAKATRNEKGEVTRLLLYFPLDNLPGRPGQAPRENESRIAR